MMKGRCYSGVLLGEAYARLFGIPQVKHSGSGRFSFPADQMQLAGRALNDVVPHEIARAFDDALVAEHLVAELLLPPLGFEELKERVLARFENLRREGHPNL